MASLMTMVFFLLEPGLLEKRKCGQIYADFWVVCAKHAHTKHRTIRQLYVSAFLHEYPCDLRQDTNIFALPCCFLKRIRCEYWLGTTLEMWLRDYACVHMSDHDIQSYAVSYPLGRQINAFRSLCNYLLEGWIMTTRQSHMKNVDFGHIPMHQHPWTTDLRSNG